jgi:hypothetical protein
MTRTIVVIIAPDGRARIQTHGFAGSQCRDASQFLETALGLVTREQPTAEFYQTATQHSLPQQVHQRPC